MYQTKWLFLVLLKNSTYVDVIFYSHHKKYENIIFGWPHFEKLSIKMRDAQSERSIYWEW